MELRKIEPGMVVHCRTEEEARALMQWAYECGYEWRWDMLEGCESFKIHGERTCYCFDGNEKIIYADRALFEVHKGDEIMEFSRLILPELTTEEVLDTIHGICAEQKSCNGACRLYDVCPMQAAFRGKEYSAEALTNICRQWMAEHGKKEPEKEIQIETVDVCRIIEILPDGIKRCVYEEDIEPEVAFGGERLAAEEILKTYCMGHEGDFIAVHEVVSRIKKE